MNAILTRQEAADYLGISTDTLDRLRSAGRIVGARMISELDDVIATLRALQASTGEGEG